MTPTEGQQQVRRTAARPVLPADRSTGAILAFERGFAPWAATIGRVLLGGVFAWFGVHELLQPGFWTGYVPFLSPTSQSAITLVLIHGWLLTMMAGALILGIAPRATAALGILIMAEIVISLTITGGGLNDIVVRDIGVLGLSVMVAGALEQRLVFHR